MMNDTFSTELAAAGFTVRKSGEQLVLSAVAEPRAFFAADARRVLALYRFAARCDATVEIETFCAANDAAAGIAALPGDMVFTAVNDMLLAVRPDVLDPLIAAHGLVAFGLYRVADCLHPLCCAPENQCARWWLLLRACRANATAVSQCLSFPDGLVQGLSIYDALAAQRPPQTMFALKWLLSRLPKCDYAALLGALALHDAAWQPVCVLYTALDASGEPFRAEQLALTKAGLRAEGMRGKAADYAAQELLRTVCKTPQMNNYPALLALARMLVQQYRR